MRHGRPLRFLGLVAGGWIGMRVVVLWPTIDSVPALLRAIVPVAEAMEPEPALAPVRSIATVAARSPRAILAPAAIPLALNQARSNSNGIAVALLGLVRFGEADDAAPIPLQPGVPRPLRPDSATTSRWSGSAWLVARGGAGIAPGVVGGQLGGSQAGVRIAYALDRRHRLALAGRVTTPLGSGLREAALGIEWQPSRLPVRIVAEERVALNDGTSGPALGVVGGFGPLALVGGFRLEGYGQAGVVDRARAEPYADGAVRATHPLATIGRARLGAGAGVWAATQRGATRVDIGPALTLDLPLAHQPVRLSLEYRARIAGNARPGSGMALSLGTNF